LPLWYHVFHPEMVAWSHFPPVQTVEKNRELRSSQRDHAVLNRWPREAAHLKSLRIQNQTRAIPGEDFDSIASLGAEHKQIAAERITAQCVRHQHRQRESWFRKSAQGDRWSFCLTAGTLCLTNQERQ
jgi:hypothetical protein